MPRALASSQGHHHAIVQDPNRQNIPPNGGSPYCLFSQSVSFVLSFITDASSHTESPTNPLHTTPPDSIPFHHPHHAPHTTHHAPHTTHHSPITRHRTQNTTHHTPPSPAPPPTPITRLHTTRSTHQTPHTPRHHVPPDTHTHTTLPHHQTPHSTHYTPHTTHHTPHTTPPCTARHVRRHLAVNVERFSAAHEGRCFARCCGGWWAENGTGRHFTRSDDSAAASGSSVISSQSPAGLSECHSAVSAMLGREGAVIGEWTHGALASSWGQP